MLFNSFSYFIFFPIVVALYFTIPHKYRTVFLLLSSCIFYMAFVPYYILILFAVILIDYYAGIKIEESLGSKRKAYLLLSIISTCIVLMFFKYFNFFNANLLGIANFFGWNYPIGFLKIILPIGLSFHTFQSLSYVIEVYWKKQKAEHNFLTYSLYVMFFPQLVAGPIERPQNLLHQFYERHYFEYERVILGLRKMLWGFFKKIVIADNLALYVSRVFDSPHDYSSPTIFIAIFFFAIQIYCDFSGYSDIAVGSAKVMGFNLMENFKNPYFSLSIPEFWRRWHVSLFTWFKDYIYIPLGGSRVIFSRWCFNIILVFLLSGLWHGANWTYIIWGLLHGFFLVGYRLAGIFTKKISNFLQLFPSAFKIFINWLITFLLVLNSWAIFRAKNISDAYYLLINFWVGLFNIFKSISASIIHFNLYPLKNILQKIFAPLPGSSFYFFFYLGLIAILTIVEIIDYKFNLLKIVSIQRRWIRWLIYFAAVLGIMNIGGTRQLEFIYFQF